MTTISDRSLRSLAPAGDWPQLAACRGQDVELFFHPTGERRRFKARRIDRAKEICRACPVIVDCAAWALRTREPYGIWGGLSEDERAARLGVRSLRYPAAALRVPGG